MSDRGTGILKRQDEILGYFVRDIMNKRGINSFNILANFNLYVRELGLNGKAATTKKGNLMHSISAAKLTWKTYLKALALFRCVKTTFTTEHDFGSGDLIYLQLVIEGDPRKPVYVKSLAGFIKELMVKRGITHDDLPNLFSAYSKEVGETSKTAATTKSYLTVSLENETLSWKQYIKFLRVLGCHRTVVSVEHQYNDSDVTYHQRTMLHRR